MEQREPSHQNLEQDEQNMPRNAHSPCERVIEPGKRGKDFQIAVRKDIFHENQNSYLNEKKKL